MNVEIELRYNYGFEVFSNEQAYVKGYFFNNGELYQGTSLLTLLSRITSIKELEELLKSSCGIFYIILQVGQKLYLASDVTRTFPLFYSVKNGKIYISDDAFFLRKKLNLYFDPESCSEYLRALYVTGENTLLKGLNQLQAGEIVTVDNGQINKKFYYTYLVSQPELFTKDYFDLLSDYLQILKNMTERLITLANGNNIVIPLSGGYDSRLIVTLLKKYGYKKIICYTYGKPNSPEVIISGKVAKILGVDWHFVEYDKTFGVNYLQEDWFYNFFRYEFNYVSTIHLQDVFAFKFLVEKEIIPKHAIIVPGHSGDFLGGSHLRKLPLPKKNGISASILTKHFVLNEEVPIHPRNLEKLQAYVEKNIEIPDIEFYSIDENWNVKERQSKFIVNSNKAYEYFGLKHAIPLWDLELVEFFRRVPLKFKIEQNLYEDGAKTLFRTFNVDFPKMKKTSNSPFFPKLRLIAEKVFPVSVKRSLRDMAWTDVNNLKVIAAPIAKNLNKKYSFSEFHGLVAEWGLKNAQNSDLESLKTEKCLTV